MRTNRLRSSQPGAWLRSFIVPRLNDLKNNPDGKKQSRLIKALGAFAARNPNVRVIDLLPVFTLHAEKAGTDFEQYFQPCDGHWSPMGNRVAAKIIGLMLPAR